MLGAASPPQPKLDLTQALTTFLAHFWWLALIVAALAAVRGLAWLLAERRLARSGITEIDRMDGITFERRLAALFRGLGYRVEPTRARGDYGADLIVEKDGVRTVVQAKRWTKNVGVKAVQEAVAAKAPYRCTHSMVITNSHFTPQAKELARANDTKLIDRDALIAALLRANTTLAVAPAAA